MSSFDNMRQFCLLSYPHVLVYDRQTFFDWFDTLVARWLAPKVPAPPLSHPTAGHLLLHYSSPFAPIILPVILVRIPHRVPFISLL